MGQTQLVTHGLLMLCDLAGFDTWNPSQTVPLILSSPFNLTPTQQPVGHTQPRGSQLIAPLRVSQGRNDLKPIRPRESEVAPGTESEHHTQSCSGVIPPPTAGLVMHHLSHGIGTEPDSLENKFVL
ncbi:unnamed protein product [Echinostoma caproni]|uniref:EH domain-containing protein n=1 Tax=Echinostoma caproni TaxID=27848 RepID=A0A183BDU5_9TREM|nr:unnamed protein product [Echinostoma caproni]